MVSEKSKSMDEREREGKRITEKYLKKKRWASSVSFKDSIYIYISPRTYHFIRRGDELRHEGSS